MSDDASRDYLEFPEPDLVLMHASRTPSSLALLTERLRSISERGRFYMIIDFTGMKGGFDAEAREKGPNMIKPEWISGCAYVNASMPIRLALKVINLTMFLAGRADFPTEFVDSMEKAHATIARFRAEAAAKSKTGT
ncbi:MAG TPA: hypothetical protein VK013_18670 [Myxococcaceae bacterium]|nr:hypothetical protein [Myxococcaceae bacterium]